jgi:hypothetical protein
MEKVDIFESAYVELLREFSIYDAQPTNALLWHFTNKTGLKGILHSNQLWFTDLSFTNDTLEIEHSINIAEKVVQSHLSAATNPLTIECLKAALDHLEGDRRSRAENGLYNVAYSVSLCEAMQFPNLWQIYGDQGKGFAIGFNVDSLRSRPNQLRVSAPTKTSSTGVEISFGQGFPHVLSLVKIIYDEDLQIAIIERCIRQLLAAAQVLKDSSSFSTEIAAMFGFWFYQAFWHQSYRFKSSVWSFEKEWRLVYRYVRQNSSTSDTLLPDCKVKIRERNDLEIPYFATELATNVSPHGDSTRLPVDKILTGPLLDHSVENKFVRGLLNAGGYDDKVEILPVDTPLRY